MAELNFEVTSGAEPKVERIEYIILTDLGLRNGTSVSVEIEVPVARKLYFAFQKLLKLGDGIDPELPM